jgi:phosphatidylglycerophosphatase C
MIERQMDCATSPPRPLVAFDFDGTLTHRDSFLAFLRWRFGPATYYGRLAGLTGAMAKYGADRDRGRLKGAIVKAFLAGLPMDDVRAAAERFATYSQARLIRSDARACWETWRRQNARLVIVTASPEVLVTPFGRHLEAEAVIGTKLTLDPQGRVQGDLDGPNCRGPEKVRRLEAVYGEDLQLTAAYGDTEGDREMLKRAISGGFKTFHAKK